MSPTQFRTQCVLNWKCIVKPTHISKVTNIKSFTKLRSQFIRKKLQKLLSVLSAFAFSTSLINLFTYIPIRRDHRKVNGSIYLSLCCNNITTYSILGLLINSWVCLVYHELIIGHLIHHPFSCTLHPSDYTTTLVTIHGKSVLNTMFCL